MCIKAYASIKASKPYVSEFWTSQYVYQIIISWETMEGYQFVHRASFLSGAVALVDNKLAAHEYD